MAQPRAHPTIGWREWVGLPDLGVESIKAKIDTGARTSALHAFQMEIEHRDDGDWASFTIYPLQRSHLGGVEAQARVIDYRLIRSSNGISQRRPVIRSRLRLGGRTWPIELTLAARDQMGFRMLLGRAAIRRRCFVDPAKSFLVSHGPD